MIFIIVICISKRTLLDTSWLLVKETPARWAGLGAPLDLNDWFGDLKTMKITYRKFVVQAVEESTHDTREEGLKTKQGRSSSIGAKM